VEDPLSCQEDAVRGSRLQAQEAGRRTVGQIHQALTAGVRFVVALAAEMVDVGMKAVAEVERRSGCIARVGRREAAGEDVGAQRRGATVVGSRSKLEIAGVEVGRSCGYKNLGLKVQVESEELVGHTVLKAACRTWLSVAADRLAIAEVVVGLPMGLGVVDGPSGC
jgi:hypothetical protein